MSNKNVSVLKHSLEIKEYRGQRVLTFEEIDTVHERPKGTAKRNFNKHQKRFIRGIDYFSLKGDVLQNYKQFDGTNFVPSKSNREMILITITGYLMLVKSFTDDLAWEVQRILVNTYFYKYKRAELLCKLAKTAPKESKESIINHAYFLLTGSELSKEE